jgi:two-component system cell cycle sensor histidine kinase/response regulator CckA
MMKILIAEDKPESLALLDSFLKKNNYQTYCAPNGKVALDILEKNQIDLIISDILMPEVDGYILCKKVKSDPRWSKIPFIFYTATFTSRQDEIFAIKLGAARFVRKPINPGEFMKIILDVLQKYKKGTLEPAQYKFKEEQDVFRLYNQRVVEKLEDTVTKLQESENRYRSLYENATIGLYRTTPDGRILLANPALVKMLGFDSFEELAARNLEKEEYFAEYPRSEFKQKIEINDRIQGLESTWQRRDGITIYVRESASVIRDESRAIKYYEGTVEDITARKHAEDSLRLSEARLSTAMKIAKLGYWEISNSDNLFTFDDHFYAIFHTTAAKEGGYKMSPEQYAKRFLHPDDQKMVASEMQKSLQATDPNYHRQLEHRIIYADGGIGWIEVNFFIKKDNQGHTIGAYGVNQDITERKHMQEMIAKEQKDLKLIIDTSPVIIFYKDIEGKFIRVNKAFADMLQMNEADFLGKTVFDLYTKEIAQSMADDDREVLESNRPKLNIVEQYQSASGLRWVQTDKIPIQDENGNPVGLIGFALDITERKATEGAFQESQDRLSKAAKIAKLGYWDYDVAEDLFTFDDHFYAIFHTTAEKVGGYKLKPEEYAKRFLYPDDQEMVGIEMQKALGTTDPSFSRYLEHRIIYADGGIGWISVTYFIKKDKQGRTIRTYGVNQDITERKQAEEALGESEQKYRFITEKMTDAVWLMDLEFKPTFISPSVTRILGYTMEELKALPVNELLTPGSFELAMKTVATELAPERLAPKLNERSVTVELEFNRKDGSPICIESTITLLRDSEGCPTGLMGVGRDITERKQAEQNLVAERDKLQRVTDGLSAVEIGIDIIDLNYHVIYQNSFLKNQFGDLTNELCYEKYMNLKEPCSYCPMVKAIETKLPRKVELTAADGKIYEILSAPLTDPDGTINKVIEIVRDITERKQAEEEYKQLINSMSETVWVINFEGKFAEVNDAAVKKLGYSREELLTMGPKDIDPNLSTVEIDQMIEGMKSDKLQNFETEHRTKDGIIIPVEINSTPVTYHGQGAILSIARDISERKQAEENIRRITEGTRAILWHAEVTKMKNESNGCLGYSWDTHYLNLENISNLLPLKGEPDTDLGQRFHNSILEEDRLRMAEVSAKAFKDNAESYDQEYRLQDVSGSLHWMREHVDIDQIDASHYKVTGIIMDICELKRVEEELDIAVRSAKVGLWNQDFRTGKITRNVEWANMLGYELSEVESDVNFFFNLIHPDDQPTVKKVLQDHESGKSKFLEVEHRMRTKDGNWKWILNLGRVVEWDAKGKPLRAAGVHLDVTERKKAEEELRESEERYRAVVENSYEGIIIVGEDYKFNYVNDTLCTMLGRKQKDIIGHDFREFLDEESKSLVADHYLRRQRGEKVPSRYEFNVVRKNGDKRRVEISSTVVRDTKGKARTIAQLLDITERKKAEEALRESEERYRLIMDNSLDAILLTDPNGPILAANKAACEMLQMTEKEICAAGRNGIVDIEDPRVAELLEKRKRDGFARGELTMIRKDGSKLPADMSSAIFYNSKGEPQTSMIIRDESERKQAEAEKLALETQLLQSQKMEAVGTLAGGIAHDFNNLLTIIQGHAQLMMAAKNESNQEYYGLKQIVNAAFRAAQLTRQLLLYSRKQEMAFEILNPNKTIDNLSKMFERLIGENIVINLQLDDNLWNIEADEGNLEQVIMNLVVNARDAMPHGGTLTIKTENLELSEQDCALIPHSKPGNFVQLTIQDTGCGVPNEVIDKIFDPFFTTKEAGKGTGLGLSVAYGIVKKHNGWINVESEPKKGTIFTICLPASQKSVLDAFTPKDQPAQKLGKGESILVIEDDGDVRKFMVTILRHYNYVPLEAADAAAATTIFQKEKKKIKLIVCDVVLPDKNGVLLVEELLAAQAHIPVIMCSGYADEKVRHDIIKKKKFRYLQKPIKAPTFLDLVQETLASAKQ